jgi:pimeloyl-ACP methyl ester carboxylesterase
MRVVYLHGFASSPQSGKARFFASKFKSRGVGIEIPALDGGDFEHLTVSSQLEIVRETVGTVPCVLMGSSLGGYLAALFATERPELVEKLVLMAPAFEFSQRLRDRYTAEELAGWKRTGTAQVYHFGYGADVSLAYGLLDDAPRHQPTPDFRQPALIFHGQRDPVVPIQLSERFTVSHPNATLVAFDSAHELTDVLEPMWEATERFLFQNL